MSENDVVPMSTDEVVDAMRWALAKRKPKAPTGTVIKFRVQDRFNYAALYVGATRRWYLTGSNTPYGTSVDHETLFDDYLMAEDVSDIKIATEWEDLP